MAGCCDSGLDSSGAGGLKIQLDEGSAAANRRGGGFARPLEGLGSGRGTRISSAPGMEGIGEAGGSPGGASRGKVSPGEIGAQGPGAVMPAATPPGPP